MNNFSIYLQINIFGSTKQIEVVGNSVNLTEALDLVRAKNAQLSSSLIVTKLDKQQIKRTVCTITKENIFDAVRSYIPCTPVSFNDDSYTNVAGMKPTKQLADWLLAKMV